MNFKILVLKNTYTIGIFKIYPINSGYGITIGNTLRRILLSSLYGYSVSYFKIKGILHEYSTIKGIIEDVTEIILNLKQIRFKLNKKNLNIEKEKINIKINNKKTKIYAGDIESFSKYFEIINKKLVICNKDESVNFNIKLIVDKGKGYLPSEKKKKYKNFIPIDSIYTPIKNVSFKVINYYEKKIKYNKEILNLNIITDGTISPIKSLIKSSKILINIFNIFYNKRQYYKKKDKKKINKYDINYLKIKKILNTKLEKENLTVRTINCLNSSKIYKWKDLVILKESDLLKIKNFGKKSLKELIKKMKERNLQFEMDINKYIYET
ncbi:MAG: DNA-directed RNA polymerase subunit alpha [Candidatus Shikimatogenerans sp. JK-2022]|nr:DNA-directed RNA polymerase subunit alpha [Candidatus Shikimatogenerans bostrichidophilus]